MKLYRKIIVTTLVLSVCLSLFLSNISVSIAAPNTNATTNEKVNETSLYETDEAQDSKKSGEIESTEIYNIYAQIIMNQKQKDEEKEDKKEDDEEPKGWVEKGKKAAKDVGKKVYDPSKVKKEVRNIIGDGGTVIDIGYTEMYSLANQLRGYKTKDEKDNIGTQMASFLSTYNHYGYISTVSGQKALVGSTDGIAKLGRTFFGGLVALALALYTGVNTLLDWVLNVLIGLNPLSLLGYGDGGKAMTDNPVSNFIHNMFEAAGINSGFFDKIADLSLVLVIIFIVVGSMVFMTIGAKRRWLQLAKKGALLIFAYTAFLPLLGFVVSGVASQVEDLRANSIVHENPANQYLFNARGWAASSNLSPTGLDGASFPMAKANDGYIDKDYDPIRSRDMIAKINERTYSTLYGMDKEKSGFDLIDKWMKNENFSVNDYMSDIRRSNLSNGEEQLPAYDSLKEVYQGYDIKKSDIATVLWSANQMYDEKSAKVTHKNYKPESYLGVRDTNSFSTQSVVLMLQSSFNNSSAHFYAYNLPPKGAQGELKNITTAKTEWKEVTMPGDGPLGVVGSWFGLAGTSIVYTVITVAVVISLLSFTILENLFRIFKNIFKLYVLLNVYAMYSITFLVLASIVTFILALSAGDMAMILINGVSSTIDKSFNGAIPSGIISIIISVVSIFVAVYISFIKPKHNAEPLIRMFVNLFMNMAFAYDDRVSRMTSMFDKSRNVENAKNKLFNRENKESANYQNERRTGYDNEGNEESEDGSPATYSSDSNSGAYVNRFARGRRQKKEMVDTRTYGKPGFGNHEMDKQESDEDDKDNNDNQSIEEQEGKTSNSYRTTNNDTSNKDNGNMTEEEKEELKKHGFIRNRTNKEVESQNENDTKTEFETSTDSSEENNTVDTRNESRSESKNKDDKNSPTKEFAKAEVKGAAQDLAFDGAESLSGVDMSSAKSAKGAYDEVQTAKEMGYTNDGKPEKVDDVVENEVDSKTGFISGNKSRNSNNKSGNSESNEQEGNTQSNSHKSDDTHSTEQANVYGNPRSRRNKNNNSSHSQSSQENKQSPKTTSNKSKEASNKPKGYEKHKGKRTKSEERARKRFERKKRSKNTKQTTQNVEQKQETSTDYEYTRAAKRKPKK